ncbi:hypothetical protein HK405_009583, partial [Cladochytrium tenue]
MGSEPFIVVDGADAADDADAASGTEVVAAAAGDDEDWGDSTVRADRPPPHVVAAVSTSDAPLASVDPKDGPVAAPDTPLALEANKPSPLPMGVEEDRPVNDWDSPEDPDNPRNWSAAVKWRIALLVSFFTLVSPMSSSMVAPALSSVAVDINDYNESDLAIIMTIFVLAYAVGPFFLAPISEVYGRMIVLQGSLAFFLVFNLLCGFAQNKAQLIAYRFLGGLGGSGPIVIGGGVITDLFEAKERGLAMAVFSAVIVLGPTVGPIAA